MIFEKKSLFIKSAVSVNIFSFHWDRTRHG